jgi:quinol-cytochrome oxidoreductase complex cytochrome b subunit
MERDEQAQAATEALTAVRAHQERTESAARVPWWFYLAMFALTTAVTGANDFVTQPKVIAMVVLVALVVVLVVTFAGRSAPLSRLRGVQRRQRFHPRIFGITLVVGAVGAWLISQYGTAVVNGIAGGLGLRGYPNTVLGVVYAAVFTALFAVVQLMVVRSERAGR